MLKLKIAIVATSSTVPQVELKLGVEKLKHLGFEVFVHPICRARETFYAGSARARAKAFLEVASRKDIDVVWCARGGYGANQLLPHLKAARRKRGLPPKLLVGYSDITALFQFVKREWKWNSLHFPMPASHSFFLASALDWKAAVAWIRGKSVAAPWNGMKLNQIYSPKRGAYRGEIVGGNLAVWSALAGTPFQTNARGKILFFEEIGENLSRVDRMVEQVKQAGMLDGVRAIVLGDFFNCEDSPPRFLIKKPKLGDTDHERSFFSAPPTTLLKEIRAKIPKSRGIFEIFLRLGRELGVPIFWTLPVGHGPHFSPLPMGATLSIDRQGRVQLGDLTKWRTGASK